VQAAKHVRDAKMYRGILSTVKSILQKEGVLGFFAGLRTKILQSVLAAALMFVLKERLYSISATSLQRLR
jgi:solute carrier family 25 (peroxisomal adenine nucleotide transporter), member 17